MFTQRILTDDDFNFHAVIDSHDWLMLAPFQREGDVFFRVHRMADGRVVRIRVQADGNTSRSSFLLVETEGEVYPTDLHEIDAAIRAIMALDWQMHDFYAALPSGYEWVRQHRVGRILRAPTVWEDMVKTLLTTNTTWKQTIGMVERLMALGDDSPFGHAFPTPQQVAALDMETLTTHIKAGYRGAYLHELAQKIVSEEINVEHWILLDSATLYKSLKSLKGFGEYATGSIMRLLGHHDRISLDSVARDAFEKVYKVRPTDAEIYAHYQQFGEWRGLIMWMDVLRDDYVTDSSM